MPNRYNIHTDRMGGTTITDTFTGASVYLQPTSDLQELPDPADLFLPGASVTMADGRSGYISHSGQVEPLELLPTTPKSGPLFTNADWGYLRRDGKTIDGGY